MAVDVAYFAGPCQDGRPIIVPNREEHLRGPRELIEKTPCLEETRTLVMMTTFSLGMLYSLSAFPRIRSDSPLEYTLAVSKVLMPLSYLCVTEAVNN